MTVGLTTRLLAADTAGLDIAARILRDGGLLAFPTETVYGLGADATNGVAVARVFAAKGRPSFNPLIAHVRDLAEARALAEFNDDALRLGRFWPGPLTLVLPRRPGCPVADLATAGLDTIAVRVPDHPVAQALLATLQRPIVAPSANRSGHVSPTAAAHVLADLGGRIDGILDGGSAPIGVESTIVACLSRVPLLLRAGGLPRADIERALGHPLSRRETAAVERGEAPLAPGMLSSHYAPRTPVRLDAMRLAPGEALLAFGPPLPGAERLLNLSPSSDLVEAAANLFSHLRALDAAGARAIAVMPIPSHGLGEAINDRLARAAAPRD
jgi:L-threonylcarbamoyladenylate synthase